VRNIRRKIAWWLAQGIISPAAAGITAWSLYVVARYFGVPSGLALTTAVVFDGIALGCLHLASEAVKAGRSAAGPLAFAFGMGGISVYLNNFHADLIHGGLPASMFFSTPTVGLLALSYLSWAGVRSQARAERGDTPMRLPSYGFLTWLLASSEAGEEVRRRAVERVTGPTALPVAAPATVHRRSADDILIEKFAALDTGEVVEILARTHPTRDTEQLADMAGRYGHPVTADEVTLILAAQRITVRRTTPAAAPAPAPAAVPAAPAPRKQLTPPSAPAAPAPQGAATVPQGAAVGQQPALADLVRNAAALLGPGATARGIAEAVKAQHGPLLAARDLDVTPSYVRTVRSRDRKAAEQQSAAPAPVQDPLSGTGQYL
jgi:hypothetical protein